MVAGNWKMNKTLPEGIQLVKELVSQVKTPKCDVVVATPYIHLASVQPFLSSSPIKLAAENCSDKLSGAFTGEVSVGMIASTGASFCIVGHSERRSYYNETFEILKDKVDNVIGQGLRPIFCIGEVREEREANCHKEVVKSQLDGSLFHLSESDFTKVIIAYEPVWAIGTGLTATPAQAQQMHAFIRSCIAHRYNENVANQTTILYGGSCNEQNALELFSNEDVDGGLIGGASLITDKFTKIIDIMDSLIQ